MVKKRFVGMILMFLCQGTPGIKQRQPTVAIEDQENANVNLGMEVEESF
jgi:hypothetical protein